MDNEKRELRRTELESTMVDSRLFETNSTESVTSERETLRTEFIVFGSILTAIFVLILVSLAAFALYVSRRRPCLPSSPIPPSPPESLRDSKVIFTAMDEESSIYEPIENFSALSAIELSKNNEEKFTEIE